jgi:hypothetical protein
MTQAPTGFQIAPSGPYKLRNYDDEELANLEPVYELVNALTVRHKVMIPGSMFRLMRGWREDLRTAINAKLDGKKLPAPGNAGRPIPEIEAASQAAGTLLTNHKVMLSPYLATLLATFHSDLALLIEDHQGAGEDEPTGRYVEIGFDK